MLYDYPHYYELAFSFRDLNTESSFLHSCIEQYSLIPVKTVLEIGCGPAPHSGMLSSSFGYRYIGIDVNPKMLAYARSKWAGCQPLPLLLKKNMVDFSLDEHVDFAFVMLGSLYLQNDAEVRSHFDAISRCLKPGGLYFMDMCIQFEDPLAYRDKNGFSIERDDVRFESNFDINLIDNRSHLYEETWRVKVTDRGQVHQFVTTAHNKAIFPDDFQRFLESRDDFRLVGWWRDWDLTQPIRDNCEIRRPFVLIRRV